MVQIPIVTIENNKCIILKSNIESVLHKCTSDIPIAVLSVIGGRREGKSFLLSVFLQYLNNYINNVQHSTSVGDVASWLTPNETVDGFLREDDDTRITKGITLYSDPLLINRDNKSLYILLMDTQGLSCCETEEGIDKAIYGITTMLSSYQILNTNKRIDPSFISYISCLNEFANDFYQSNGTKPFQVLDILVRDYQNFSDNKISEWIKQGRAYWAEYKKHELQQNHFITNTYEVVRSFCLPYPGLQVAGKNKVLFKDFDPLFAQLISVYVEEVIQTITPLKLFQNELSCDRMADFIIQTCELFADTKHFPSSNALQSLQNLYRVEDAMKTCAIQAQQKLWDSFFFVGKYIEPASLKRNYEAVVEGMNRQFDSEFPSSSELIDRKRRIMQEMVSNYFDSIETANMMIKPYKQVSVRRYGICGPREKWIVYPELKYKPQRPSL